MAAHGAVENREVRSNPRDVEHRQSTFTWMSPASTLHSKVFTGRTAGSDLGVPVARFYSLLETICPGGPSLRPGQMVAVAGDTTRLYRLRRAINALVMQPELDPQHERQANLIAEIIAWMGDSSSQWQPQGFSVNGARIQIARRARDYMEDHFPEPIRLADICRETRVSLRTMRRAFVEYFHVSPYAFLKKLRLDRARRELLAGEPESHSVTTIALNHGYIHLSRFSADYREAFGELPRETLTRPLVDGSLS